jgi:hypothetical protein
VRTGVGARGLDDLDALVDDDLAVLVVRRGSDARQDREVDPERLVGEVAGAGDLLGQVAGGR